MNGKQAKRLTAGLSKSLGKAVKRAYVKGRVSAAQQPKPLKVRRRVEAGPSRPTWPATGDQIRQSRPLIIVKPVRRLLEQTPEIQRASVRQDCIGESKHVLDGAARQGWI